MPRGRKDPSEAKKSLDERINESPNATLCGYLREWYQQATARQDRLQFVYRRALMSLIEYPHPISQMKGLEKLKGIGPNIRARLEQRLKTDTDNAPSSGIPLPPTPKPLTASEAPVDQVTVSGSASDTEEDKTKKKASRKRPNHPPKPYVPAYRSGPYAMLIALYVELHSHNSKGYLTRQEVINNGQSYCASPMDEGTFSPIQGAIKSLTSKELVSKTLMPPRYSLTEAGLELATRLWNSGERRSSAPLSPIISPPRPRASVVSPLNLSGFEEFTLNPGEFEVILLVDTREVKSREERDFIVTRLNDAGVRSEQRNLELGDFIWIAKAKPGIVAPDEIVLDHIVERKREDDLISSIPDGRFVEQKFRLKSSGIRNLIYLVEKVDRLDYRAIGQDRFEAAILHTQVVDGFSLRYTSGMEETLRFLVAMSTSIASSFGSKSLRACIMHHPVFRDRYLSYLREQNELSLNSCLQSYGCHAQINSKSANLTIRDVFTKQLLTIRGITAEKALAVASNFPSLMSLWRHYQSLSDGKAREYYFKDMAVGDNQRKFGLVLSQKLYQLLCADNYKDS